jgi:hypothetical protein
LTFQDLKFDEAVKEPRRRPLRLGELFSGGLNLSNAFALLPPTGSHGGLAPVWRTSVGASFKQKICIESSSLTCRAGATS